MPTESTPDAQRHALYAIAQAALTRYDLKQVSLAWLAYTHNAVFDVQTANGRYVLRLHLQPDDNALQAELAWLQHLAQVGAVTVQTPVATRDGHLYEMMAVDAAISNKGPVAISLLTYLEGQSRTMSDFSADEAHATGAMIARLHQTAPSDDITHALPRLDADGLFSETGRYPLGDMVGIFSEAQQAILQAVTQQVRRVMDEMAANSGAMGWIHGDLLLKNLLFQAQMVSPIDFEYCGWGFYLYDIAPLLWQLKSLPDSGRYQALAQAVQAGYTTVQPLTYQHHLETFIAGRQVASLRWLAGNQQNPMVKANLHDLITQRIHELEGFLHTGTLERHSITL